MFRSLLFLLLTLYFVWSKTQENSNKLHLLVLAPFPSDFHPKPTFSSGHSLVPAVELAVEHINNSSRVLPNHTVEIIVGDSGCNITAQTALPFVRHLLSGEKQVLGIAGPACTEASLLLANITKSQESHRSRYGIIQAMMATSDVFDDHQRYQHTFGMVSSFSALVSHLISIASEQQWTNIGVLYDQSRGFFGRTFDSFVRQANAAGIFFNSWPVLAPDYLEKPLNDLKNNHNNRIILAILGADTARHVACWAGIKGLTFPRYQFVYTDRSVSNFLAGSDFNFTDSETYNCDKNTIRKGLNGSLLLHYGLNSISNDTYLDETAKLTVGEVKAQYHKRLKERGEQRGENLTVSSYAFPYYDATWALALSIHQAFEEIGSFSMNNLRFLNDSREGELLRQKFENLSFQGVSVKVEFNSETGRVENEIDLFQVNGEETFTQNLTLLDSRFKTVYLSLDKALIVIGLALTLATLLLTIVLHYVNIHFRDYVTVKGSSPRLNNFIFLSLYLVLLCVFFETIHYGFITDFEQEHLEFAAQVICNLESSLFPLCLSLVISTVFMKLWRLYSIFSRSFKRQVLLTDKQLALVILAMQTVVILLSIPLLATDRLTLDRKETFNTDEEILYVDAVCYTNSWLLTLPYTVVLILAALSFLLAYLNRKIRQNQYRSKETIIFTYLFCLMLGILVITFAVSLLSRPTIDVSYSLHSFSYLGMVLLCNTVLFVPPFYSILVGKFRPPKKTVTYGVQIFIKSNRNYDESRH